MKEIKAQQVVGLLDPTQSNAAVNKNYSDLQALTVANGAGVWYHYPLSYSDLATIPVAQVDTLSFVEVDATLYQVGIGATNYSYTSIVGDTVAGIVAGLLAAINADSLCPASASGTGTLILTAKVAGTPFVTSNPLANPNIGIAHTVLNQSASNTKSVELFKLPAGGVMQEVLVTHSAAFTGGSITDYEVTVGTAVEKNRYVLGYDVFQAPGATVAETSNALGFENKAAQTSIQLTAVSTGDTLDHATAGALDVYIRWSVVTQVPLLGQTLAYDEFFHSFEKVSNLVAQNINTSQYFTMSETLGSITYNFLQDCSIEIDIAITAVGTASPTWDAQTTIVLNGTKTLGATQSSSGFGGVYTTTASGKAKVTNGDQIVVTITNINSTNQSCYVSLDGKSLKQVIPSLPSGLVLPFAGPYVPAGYLLCDGTSVPQSSYPTLFAAIGFAWGLGSDSGATTFSLPDLRGQFLRGVDAGAGVDPDTLTRTAPLGGNVGDAVGSYQGSLVGPHNHTLTTGSGWGGNNGGVRPYWDSGDRTAGSATGTTDGNGGTGTGAETRPTNAYVNYIIKV